VIRRALDKFRQRRQFWESVPLRGHVLILAAIFSIFSIFGFLSDVMSLGRGPWGTVLVNALLSGVVSVFWALAIMRHAVFVVPAIGLFVFLNWMNGFNGPAVVPAPLHPLQARLAQDAGAVIVAVTTGYALFIVFIASEGQRYLRAHAEVSLAREIHQRLVPPIVRRIGGVDFYGSSIPSSEVGGDLVDVVERGDGWVAYLADVSGHGVASGALMGMFKSAMRTRLAAGGQLGPIFDDVDRVVMELRKPGMFVTCAMVTSLSAGELQFVVAGHPPVLHYRRATATVDELSTPQPPLALIDERRPFVSARVTVAAGDVLALVSDGLMEVFDRGDREYGIDRIKATLVAHGTRPLEELFDAVMGGVRKHGTQLDDQSLLLVRVGATHLH
jgi:serine phosphatase RsbU (regulator of sigma subunit)